MKKQQQQEAAWKWKLKIENEERERESLENNLNGIDSICLSRCLFHSRRSQCSLWLVTWLSFRKPSNTGCYQVYIRWWENICCHCGKWSRSREHEIWRLTPHPYLLIKTTELLNHSGHSNCSWNRQRTQIWWSRRGSWQKPAEIAIDWEAASKLEFKVQSHPIPSDFFPGLSNSRQMKAMEGGKSLCERKSSGREKAEHEQNWYKKICEWVWMNFRAFNNLLLLLGRRRSKERAKWMDAIIRNTVIVRRQRKGFLMVQFFQSIKRTIFFSFLPIQTVSGWI